MAPPATARANWVCWCQRACRSDALRLPSYSRAPRARSTLCILQSASGRPVRLPMRSACGWRRKSTGPARIRPGVTRSTEVSRASSLLHVARLNPRGPVEHDSSLLIDCGAERCSHPKWSQFAASHCIHTPTDPGALLVSRAGAVAAAHLLSTAHSTSTMAAQSAECAD